jgi:hypothetical protein
VSAALALAAALALFVLWRVLAPSGTAIDPARTADGSVSASAIDPDARASSSPMMGERTALESAVAETPPSSTPSTPTAVARTTRVDVVLTNAEAVAGPWRVQAERDRSPPPRIAGRRSTGTPAEESLDEVIEPSAVASDWLASTGERASLTLDEGRWIVRASGAEWSSESRRVTATGGTVDLALDVFIDCTVVGRCVDAEGVALGATALTLRVVAPAEEAPTVRAATCDDDGYFVFERVPARAFELAPGTNAVAFTTPQSFEARAPTTDLGAVVWPRLATLTVEVVDANGAPIAGAAVVVTGHPRGEHAATSDRDGRAFVAGVPSLEGRAHAELAGVGRGNTPFAFDARAPQKVVVRLASRADDPRKP